MNKKLLSALSLLMLILTLSCSEDNGISKVFQEKRYESAGHVTDPRDGQTYRTVKIGNLTWTAENMNYKTDSSWCYGGMSANCSEYGRLYSWQDAAMNACPQGWHLPANSEFDDLKRAVGDDSRLLRDRRWGGADRHGFSALAGGWRNASGVFFELGSYANWWSFTGYSLDSARYWEIAGDAADTFYGELYYGNVKKAYGMSARCVEGRAERFLATFNANGGAGGGFYAVGVENGQNLSDWELPVPARAGYVFEGWFSGEERYNPNAPVTQNMAFAARWRALPKATVTFDPAGGSAVSPGAVTVDSGTTIGSRMPADPAKEDSVFVGWFDGEAQYTGGSVITRSVTLAARWRGVSVFTVSFNTNGGTPSTIAAAQVDSGSLFGAAMPANPAKTDSSFVGWFDGATQYAAETVITKTVTLAARWGKWVIVTGTLKDSRDGAAYKTVTIDGRVWMAENLNYETDGGSWCYGNSYENCARYGRLYDWSTAMNGYGSSAANPSGVQGICPAGWHLPSHAEWGELITYAGERAGDKLSAATGWEYGGSSYNGTDNYGFSALPGGFRYSNGKFDSGGSLGFWWTATEYNSEYIEGRDAYGQRIIYNSIYVDDWNTPKDGGASVRCVQD